MKNIFLPVIIVLVACSTQAQFSSAKLTAAGLTCAMCTKSIYKSLEKIPSIEKVDADIQNSSFLIRFKKDAAVDPDALKDAVEQAGFSVSDLSLTGNFNHIPIANNAHVKIGGKVYHILQTHNKTVLDGEERLNMVDKKFLTTKAFKKYEAAGGHQCLESGKAEECCPKGVVAANSRVYHVIVLN